MRTVLYIPAIDRVSCRLLVYVFFVCVIYAGTILNKLLIKNKFSLIIFLSLALMAYEILTNFFGWFVYQTEAKSGIRPDGLISYPVIYPSINNKEELYEAIINVTLPLIAIFNVFIFFSIFYVIYNLDTKMQAIKVNRKSSFFKN
jgi:hypothetical protein